MTEVLFYHLTERKLEDALPPLLDRSIERGWRVAVQMRGADLMEKLDGLLWTYRPESFLPHGTEDGELAEEQPILLTTTAENRNGASVRFIIDGAQPPPDLSSYVRAVFLFDGYNSEELDHARAEWKRLRGEGMKLAYWQQNAEGRWEKKMET